MWTEISMLTAFIIICIILLSGGARMYFKRKFDITPELKMIQDATDRHTKAKQRLHNVQH